LIEKKVSREYLKEIAEERFGDMIKAVVDLEKRVMAIGGELHADEESFLLERSSKQEDLWGINLYPDEEGKNFIVFDSMINIRPKQNNRSRDVEDERIRKEIIAIVDNLVT